MLGIYRVRLMVLSPLSTIFQPYRGDQFYRRRTRNTWRKLPICHKLLTNFIKLCCIGYTSPTTEFELTTLVVMTQVVVNPTNIRPRPRQYLVNQWYDKQTMQINSEHKHYCNKTIAIFYLLTDSLLVRVNSIYCNITGKYVTEKHVGIQYIITCYACRSGSKLCM